MRGKDIELSMNEIVCPHCGAISPEEALYCMKCSEPIRCKNCGASILADANACIKCGTLVFERESGRRRFSEAPIIPPGYNRLTVHQKAESYQYDADFVFSDTVGQQTGAFVSHLAGFGAPASASRPIPQPPQPQMSNVVEVANQQQAFPQLEADSGQTTGLGVVYSPAHNGVMTPDNAIREVFAERDGKLTLLQSDMKTENSTQVEYTLRLVHVFLYAHQVLLGDPNASRAEVYELTDFAGLPRENVMSYLARDSAIERKGDALSLKMAGIEHARKCLLEIVDPLTVGKYLPSTGSGKPTTRGKRSPKRIGDTQIEDNQMVVLVQHLETRALVQDISHDVLSDMGVLDKVIVALYGLYKAGHQEEVYYSTIATYLYDAFQIKVSTESIRSSLRTAMSHHNKYVVHKDGEGYRITPSGLNYVDALRVKGGNNTTVEQPELAESQGA